VAKNYSDIINFELFSECLDRSYSKPLYNEVLACIVLLIVLSILFLVKIFKNYIINLFSSDEVLHMQNRNPMERASGYV
jgi:hypothetical protein